MKLQPFIKFISERHAVYERRVTGQPWPWTSDPILQKYRFCNVYRNLDKETQLIHRHWLGSGRGNARYDSDVWFAMTVARLVNWWPSLKDVGYPVPWHPGGFKAALNGRRAAGLKVFTGAYMVRADAVIGGTKADYIADFVLTPMWEARALIRPRTFDTLAAFHTRLMRYRDMGSFMAAQVVADVKYAHGGPLEDASDWETWAAPGPGSLRGLNRVMGWPVNEPWGPGLWEVTFATLQAAIKPKLPARLPLITGQDLQNCLCEYDKYMRVKLGEGKPRSLYQPPKEN